MNKKKSTIITKGSTLFLRVVVLAVAAAVLALCLLALPAMWRAVPREFPDHTYVFYSLITILYTAAIPFFYAVRQAIKLLGYVDKNKAFSKLSVIALRKIAYCGVAISITFAASLPFLYIWAEYEDAPGLIVIGMIMTLAPLAVTVFAAVVQRLLNEAIRIKSENDLTV